MRKGNIISLIALLLGLLFLQWGCVRNEPQTAEDTDAISFDAGLDLITRSTLIERTSFNNGEHFKVFARRTGEGKKALLFGNSGTDVTWNGSAWTYSPSQYWYWLNAANYYDFLASFGEPSPADPAKATVRMLDDGGQEIPGNLAILKPYSLADNYDLMLAGARRKGDAASRSSRVVLQFQHMLSAVRVIVTNESSAKGMTLTSISFSNLINQASAKVTIDNLDQPEFSWIDTQRPGSKVVFSGSEALAAGGGSYTTALPDADHPYQLLIPTDLSETKDGSPTPELENYNGDVDAYTADALLVLPCLEVKFQVGSDPEETHYIILKDIQKSRYATDDPISEWEMGVKYTYNIGVRLDGGVIVTVTTTEWDEIKAETPGLLIE